jgi:hypothetical protein
MSRQYPFPTTLQQQVADYAFESFLSNFPQNHQFNLTNIPPTAGTGTTGGGGGGTGGGGGGGGGGLPQDLSQQHHQHHHPVVHPQHQQPSSVGMPTGPMAAAAAAAQMPHHHHHHPAGTFMGHHTHHHPTPNLFGGGAGGGDPLMGGMPPSMTMGGGGGGGAGGGGHSQPSNNNPLTVAGMGGMNMNTMNMGAAAAGLSAAFGGLLEEQQQQQQLLDHDGDEDEGDEDDDDDEEEEEDVGGGMGNFRASALTNTHISGGGKRRTANNAASNSIPRRTIQAAQQEVINAEDALKNAERAYEQAKIRFQRAKLSLETANAQAVDPLLALEASKPWNKSFMKLQQYHAIYGNCNVTRNSAIPDAIKLCKWVNRQRATYHKGELEEWKVLALNRLGMDWNAHSGTSTWQKYYHELKNFHAQHGHIQVPYTSKYSDLYSWLKRQREHYKNFVEQADSSEINAERVRLLEQLGMTWAPTSANRVSDGNFRQLFQELKDYYNQHGHVKFPRNDKGKLASFVKQQRQYYKTYKENGFQDTQNMDTDRVNLLESLGIVLDPDIYKEHEWNETFAEIKVRRLVLCCPSFLS